MPEPGDHTPRRSVRMTDGLWGALGWLAEARRTSRARLIAQAVERLLREAPEMVDAPDSLGAYRSRRRRR